MDGSRNKDYALPDEGWPWMASVALVCGSATTCVTATFLGLVFGSLIPEIAWVSLIAGLGAALCACLAMRGANPTERAVGAPTCSIGLIIASIAFALFALRAFGWLCYRDGDGLYITSPNNLGDLALHITFIRHLISGAVFWPDNPIFAGHPLRYPLGTDLLNATLCLAGYNLYRGLIFVGLAGSFATWAALKKWGGAFAITGFLCSGGLAGFAILWTGHWVDYQSDLAWKNLPLALFVTQRGLLHALPCGLLLLDSWRTRFDPSPGRSPLPREVEWLLYESLPLFHLHSFIFLSLILLSLFLFGPNPFRRHALWLGALSLVPATSLVLLVSGFETGGGKLHASMGWMIDAQHPIRSFFTEYGILPPLLIALMWNCIRRRKLDRISLVLVPSALALWILFNFVMLAPWDWDNIKLIFWCYLLVLPSLWRFLLAPLSLPLRAPLLVLLFFSGAVSLIGGLGIAHQHYRLTSLRDMADAEAVLWLIPPNAVIAGQPTHAHPALLVGRKLVMGYTGHMWSHGYAYSETETRLNRLLSGAPEWRDLASELGADYIIWTPEERSTHPDTPGVPRPWESSVIGASGSIQVYSTQR